MFSEFEPVAPLSFLATMKADLEDLEKLEGISVWVIPYFITDDAKDVNQAHIATGTRNQTIQTTWRYIVNSLICRFLTDDLLQ